MAVTPSLAALPPALQARILGFLDRPRDLFSAINSCRAVSAGFEANEETVLVQVAVNAFGMNLHEAIGLLKVPAFQDGDAQPVPGGLVKKSSWSDQVQSFTETLFHAGFSRRTYAVPTFMRRRRSGNDYNKNMVVRLLRLATNLEEWIKEYMDFFRSMASTQIPLQCRPFSNVRRTNASQLAYDETSWLSSPSKEERYRIQRAFIRFEIMCRLFSIPYWRMLMATSDDETTENLEAYATHDYNSMNFMKLIKEKYEAEQVLSIAAFVRAQHRAILSEIRRDFEAKISSAENEAESRVTNARRTRNGAQRFSVEHFMNQHPMGNNPNYWLDFQYLRGRRETPGSSSNEIEHKIDNIASGFGLAYLKKLLMMPKTRRLAAFRILLDAIDPIRPCIEEEGGYDFDFVHTNTDVVLPHTEPDPPRPTGIINTTDDSVNNSEPTKRKRGRPRKADSGKVNSSVTASINSSNNASNNADNNGADNKSDSDKAGSPNAESTKTESITDARSEFAVMDRVRQRLVGYWFWNWERTFTNEFNQLEDDWLVVDDDSYQSPVVPSDTTPALTGEYHDAPSGAIKQCFLFEDQYDAIINGYSVKKFKDEREESFDKARKRIIAEILNQAVKKSGYVLEG